MRLNAEVDELNYSLGHVKHDKSWLLFSPGFSAFVSICHLAHLNSRQIHQSVRIHKEKTKKRFQAL